MKFLTKKTAASIAAASMLFTLNASVSAQEDGTGFYAGIGISRSDADAVQFSESSNDGGIRVGYMFTENFGVDLSATSLGADSGDEFEVDVAIIGLSALGYYPITEQVGVYGKLGGARIAYDLEEKRITQLHTSSDTHLFGGIGGEYRFTNIDLFLELNRYNTDELDVNTLFAGIKYRF